MSNHRNNPISQTILALYYTHKRGGFCGRLYRLLNALSARGHTVIYLTLDPESVRSALPSATIRRIPFPLRSRAGVLFWLLFILWSPVFAAWVAIRERPHRLLAFGAVYSALLLPARILTGVRLPLFVRSLVFSVNAIRGESRILQRFSSLLEWVGFVGASSVVVMTRSMGEEITRFIGSPPRRLTVLPNDLPCTGESFRCSESPMPMVLYLGTLSVIDERKNLGLLIDAWCRAISIHSGSTSEHRSPETGPRLLIGGDGPLLDSLRAQAERLGGSSISFVGWIDDPQLFLRSLTCFIHPSLHEGISNALLEAVCAGLPVIASDIPEHREILDHDELLFSPSEPDELVNLLVRLMRNPHELTPLRALTVQATEKLRFDWDARACDGALEVGFVE